MLFRSCYAFTIAIGGLLLCSIAICSSAQKAPTEAGRTPTPKHFDHVLIVVLENQSYESAIGSDLLKKLSLKGAVFSNFGNLYHHSYPNYLAMIAGSDFDTHKRLNNDAQVNFHENSAHRTIADLLNWRNYAEDYSASPTDQQPFLGSSKGKYARKHVPFLSFQEVKTKSFHNVVAVDTHANDNAFATDVGSFIADPQKHPLSEYMLYSPNLDDDGHDPVSDPPAGLKKASDWLRMFLTTWLRFDETTWIPKDEQMKRTFVIITFNESEGHTKPERLYAVFVGAMIKPQEVRAPYNHYSVLRTIEDNFGLEPIHKQSGDGTASVITGIWK
jgi:hypothetical protein